MVDWLALAEVASGARAGDHLVAWCDDASIERRQWLAAVRRWRAAFAAVPGSRVALYFDDAVDFAAALYGAWHAGKSVFLPGDAQPATLARVQSAVDACAGDLPGALAPAARDDEAPLFALDRRDARLTVFTSGSGGEPMAIDKQLAQLDAEVHALQAAFGAQVDVDGPVTVHATVSHQHIYGLLFLVLWPLAAGRPMAPRRIDYPEQMLARLGPGPSVLVSSPAHLGRLPEVLDWRGARAGLRAVFSSGGPLPPEAAADTLARLGQAPIEVFGSSETGGIAWRQRALHGERWQALPGVQWRLDDGLLAVRSAHLLDLDWWPTSDRVEALDDGGFRLIGRADRIVKVGEKRVSLSAIERELVAGDEVRDARAFLLGDGPAARLAVVAVLSDAGAAQLARAGKRAFNELLRARLLLQVERLALPRRWRYVAALPVNSQGKSTEALLSGLFRPALPVPRWLDTGTASASLEATLDPALLVFDGHFPQRPILPGVAQVDWAVTFARRHFVLPARFLRIEALKFQRVAEPGMVLRLELDWKPESGCLGFAWTSAAGSHARGRIVFEASDAV